MRGNVCVWGGGSRNRNRANMTRAYAAQWEKKERGMDEVRKRELEDKREERKTGKMKGRNDHTVDRYKFKLEDDKLTWCWE